MHTSLEKKVASHLAIVADRQYFSLVHVSSLLLQLIGSYGEDWPVYQSVLQKTPLGIALFSQAQYLIWMFQECQFSFRACISWEICEIMYA
jgi:hypothetical protein